MAAIRILLAGVIIFAAFLSGCGGGGGSSTTPPPLSDTVRSLQAGDTWVYTVTGTANSGSSSIPIVGAITKTISNQTVSHNGTTLKVVTWTGTVAGVGYSKTLSSKEYITQDANGSIWIYGGEDQGGVYWIVTPASGRNEYAWSPFINGQEWGVAEEISGPGGTVSFNRHYTVTGSTAITVPAGRFDVYTVTGTGYFAGSVSDEELWWAPQIGAPVQMHIEADDTEGGKQLDLNFRLASWNR